MIARGGDGGFTAKQAIRQLHSHLSRMPEQSGKLLFILLAALFVFAGCGTPADQPDIGDSAESTSGSPDESDTADTADGNGGGEDDDCLLVITLGQVLHT